MSNRLGGFVLGRDRPGGEPSTPACGAYQGARREEVCVDALYHEGEHAFVPRLPRDPGMGSCAVEGDFGRVVCVALPGHPYGGHDWRPYRRSRRRGKDEEVPGHLSGDDCDRGWVCEQHPTLPWPHGACPGPGMPCGEPAHAEGWLLSALTASRSARRKGPHSPIRARWADRPGGNVIDLWIRSDYFG